MKREKPIADRIAFVSVFASAPERPGAIRGVRRIVIRWGGMDEPIGMAQDAVPHGWHSWADRALCRGKEHIFDPSALDQRALRLRELKAKVVEAVRASEQETARENEARRAAMPRRDGPRRVMVATTPWRRRP